MNLKLVNPNRKNYNKSRPSTNHLVKYINNEFKVKVRGKLYDVDGYDFDKSKYVYSKPNNDAYDKWTKLGNNINNDNKAINIIKKVWATLYDGMKVKGKIINDKFIVRYE